MPLIKNGQLITDDSWELSPKGETSNANAILPVASWNEGKNPERAVWLDSDQAPEALQMTLENTPLVAINFPVFADGRGYSYARILRKQMQYNGDIRAIGDILVDQLHYLSRCGFTSFELRDDQNIEHALAALESFSVSYQGSVDDAQPAFRRRG